MGKVRSLLLSMRSGSLIAWWVWHICQFQRFGKRYPTIPTDESTKIECYGVETIVKFARKKSSYQDYCNDIP